MLKSILVSLAGTDTDAVALATAFAVARPFEAEVDALFVRLDPRDAVPMLGEGMSGAMVDEIMRAAEGESSAHARDARRTFDAAVAQAGDLRTHWRELTGRADELVTQEGRLYDLLVFAHTALNRDAQAYTVVETALLGCGRPILLSPASPPASVGSVVAVCWNGSAESARAVAAAMPFLHKAKAVHVLTAETAVTRSDAGRHLADYLARHRIACQVTPVTPGSEPVAAALLGKASEVAADLVIMGGYGHSRMREMILGGVTRYVLSHASLPVLMAH